MSWKDQQAYWRSRGLSLRAANSLMNENCLNLNDVRKLGRYHFIHRVQNCGKVTAAEIGMVLFGENWGPTPEPFWQYSDDALIDALEKRGYTVQRKQTA